MLVLALSATETRAQISAELSWGADRNVDSMEPELDGWLNGTVEWMFPSGVGLGIGVDNQFEGASLAPSDYLGLSIYVSSSYELPADPLAPFVRAGFGVGRAPCEGDTCGDGMYLRGSGGLRLRVSEAWRLTGEVAVTRVSRPLGGLGVSVRF